MSCCSVSPTQRMGRDYLYCYTFTKTSFWFCGDCFGQDKGLKSRDATRNAFEKELIFEQLLQSILSIHHFCLRQFSAATRYLFSEKHFVDAMLFDSRLM